MDDRTVAVIGGGIAGLAASYVLTVDARAARAAKSVKKCQKVTLFESSKVLGGHALTHFSATAEGDVDLGFQVFNMTTYPHLIGLFGALGVQSEASDMSFSLSTTACEWGSRGLSGIFAQKKNACDLKFLNMIREITRFGREAVEVLDEGAKRTYEETTLGEYLAARGYSAYFQENYVVPMCAAIWSCSDKDAMAFPVRSLIRFWANHHLLNIVERPAWRVVRGRSKEYVDAVERELDDVRKGAFVKSVQRNSNGNKVLVTYEVVNDKGKSVTTTEMFDDVIFACHSDQALRILGNSATAEEAAALGAIKYQENDVYLHTDETLMPRTRDAWASWNCIKGDRLGNISKDAALERSVCVTYWVNLLQNLAPGSKDVFVTLNPPRAPRDGSVEHKVTLAHPLFNKEAIAAQEVIKRIQGKDRVWFCGAWCGYGFHEDGIKSAVDCVDAMLGKSSVPWMPRACDPHLNASTKCVLPLFTRGLTGWLPPNKRLRMILPDGTERVMCGKNASEESETSTITVFNQRLFLQTILRSDIGLGECYMNGDFDVDLIDFLDMICKGHPGANDADATKCKPKMSFDPVGLLGEAVNWVGAKMEMAAHKALSNTKEGSRKNIEYHYDAGNDFYKLFLDETMLYSSAIHGDIHDPKMSVDVLRQFKTFQEQEAHLEASQFAKIDAMIERADIKPGDHVLEIGCGWGACAIRMARMKKCKVTGLTLSHEQHAEATARIKAAGLSHLIDIKICDYRDVQGSFDKLVSIEMLEAVGHEHLPSFFSTVHRVLKPGGKAAIQVITMPDGRYESYCNSESDFIRAYIFPGGHLPSIGAMKNASPRGLQLTSYDDIGLHYAVTLRLWRDRMMARAGQILAMGYSRKFLRMFEFYFAYCEAAFANKLIYDLQMTWTKTSDDTKQTFVEKAAHTPDVLSITVVGAVVAAYARERRAAEMMELATATGMFVGAYFGGFLICAVVFAAIISTVSLPVLGRKVSKVKLDEASTATGTLTERCLALSEPFAKAAVALFLGVLAARFAFETQDFTSVKTLQIVLPSYGVGKAGAVGLLRTYAACVTARATIASVRRDQSAALGYAWTLAVVACALHFDVFVVACACTIISECSTAAKEFRTFARKASGFPHYDSAAYGSSRVFAALAVYACVLAPAAYVALAVTHGIVARAIIWRTTLGALTIINALALGFKAAYVVIVEAQDASAELAIRRRILARATSADI